MVHFVLVLVQDVRALIVWIETLLKYNIIFFIGNAFVRWGRREVTRQDWTMKEKYWVFLLVEIFLFWKGWVNGHALDIYWQNSMAYANSVVTAFFFFLGLGKFIIIFFFWGGNPHSQYTCIIRIATIEFINTPISDCGFHWIVDRLRPDNRQTGPCHDGGRRETGEQDFPIDCRVLDGDGRRARVDVNRRRRDPSRLRDKKHFDDGFHHGILVHRRNGVRGHRRKLQTKITDGNTARPTLK